MSLVRSSTAILLAKVLWGETQYTFVGLKGSDSSGSLEVSLLCGTFSHASSSRDVLEALLSVLTTVRWRTVVVSLCWEVGPTFFKATAVDILGKGIHKSMRNIAVDSDCMEKTAEHRGHGGV
jgi:hypothetical protein